MTDNRGQLLADGRRGQTCEVHLSRHRFPEQVGDDRRVGLLGLAVVQDEQEPLVGERPCHVLEEQQRRLIGPVDVVEDDHHGRASGDVA